MLQIHVCEYERRGERHREGVGHNFIVPLEGVFADVELQRTVEVLEEDFAHVKGIYSPYIKGIKTGTTDNAGRCVVTRYQNNGKDFLLVIMGAPMEGTQNSCLLYTSTPCKTPASWRS